MKIKINATLKSKNETHYFKGKGIKNNNTITYKDDKVTTKIKIEDILIIERNDDYSIKLNLKKGIKQKGEYITKYGSIKVDTFTKNLKIKENKIETIYDLFINDEYVDTFEYILEYSIDRAN